MSVSKLNVFKDIAEVWTEGSQVLLIIIYTCGWVVELREVDFSLYIHDDGIVYVYFCVCFVLL